MRKMIIVKVDRCVGCKSCEMACAVEHSKAGEPVAAALARERISPMVSVLACRERAVPVHCGHCEDAPCLLACPTGAIYRMNPDDPVLVDAERCVGCRVCVQACPFGMIVMHPADKGVLKCDLCIERLKKGEDPACVTGCPTGALVFGEEKTAVQGKRREAASRILAGRQERESVQE